MRKRVFVLVLATVLCLSFLTTAAFAHHGSDGHHNQSCPYTQNTCPYQDCPYHHYSSGGHHNQSCPYTQYTCTDQNCTYHHGGGAGNTHHTAHCGSHGVHINSHAVTFDTYAVRDANGYETNYIPIRDLACHLNDSSACFSVGWDGKNNTISVVSGESYKVTGSELKPPFSGDVDYQLSSSKLVINGKTVELEAILLKDSSGKGITCYKLRDLGEALDFNVSWVPGTGIVINTDEPYSDAN